MIFKSIKWRLQLWYGLLLLAVLVGFGVAAFQLERGRVLRRIDGELSRRLNPLAGVLREPARGGGGVGGLRLGALPGGGPPPREPLRPEEEGGEAGGPLRPPAEPPRNLRLPPAVAGLFDESDTNAYYFRFVWRDGREVLRSANAPADLPSPAGGGVGRLGSDRPSPEVPAGERPLRRPGVGEPPVPYQRGHFREVELITPPGERVLVGRNIAGELAELRRVAFRLALVGGGVLLLGLAGGWWLASRAIRPIGDISATATRIAGGDLSQRINTSETESELGQLAGVLNSTFDRLESAFAQQQRFTADAAHELRTPVTVVLTQIQSTLNKERSPAEYRETLEACQRAAQRMRRLVESLLELARLDAGQASGKREPMDLAACAAECLELVHPLAAERRISLQADLKAAACVGDADQLALVITNLLTNAVHYNRDGGGVWIASRVEDGAAVMTITDNGPGIAPEHVPHIFDRFYRADAARTSAQGRTGLGLAITRAIVEAHGGTITVASESGKGTVFEVRLPGSGA